METKDTEAPEVQQNMENIQQDETQTATVGPLSSPTVNLYDVHRTREIIHTFLKSNFVA